MPRVLLLGRELAKQVSVYSVRRPSLGTIRTYIGSDDEMLTHFCGFGEQHFIVSDIIRMKEVDEVILIWSGEGLEKDVRVAGEFSNWEPLTLSRCDDGKWRLR